MINDTFNDFIGIISTWQINTPTIIPFFRFLLQITDQGKSCVDQTKKSNISSCWNTVIIIVIIIIIIIIRLLDFFWTTKATGLFLFSKSRSEENVQLHLIILFPVILNHSK
jgi:hypothetical protein